ncbi:MAG: hypothetical protein IPL92_08835 [Saprospiraceae bacterium]|nr:hypothetical protein [Candidatus Opimibacter iunctus]
MKRDDLPLDDFAEKASASKENGYTDPYLLHVPFDLSHANEVAPLQGAIDIYFSMLPTFSPDGANVLIKNPNAHTSTPLSLSKPINL